MTTPNRFEIAAATAVRRVVLIDACAMAQRGWPVLVLAAAGAAGAALVGRPLPMVALVALPIAAVGLAAWAWVRRPAPAEALARWDHAASRHDGFSTAWHLAVAGRIEPLAIVHLQRMSAALDRAELSRDLPLRLPARPLLAGIALALALGGGPAISALVHPQAADQQLDAAARSALGADLASVAADSKRLEANHALSAGEKKAAEQLQEDIAAAVDPLTQPGAASQAALEKLDELARQAEALAASLAAAQMTVSADMLAALAERADLAGLADALKQGDRQAAAKELAELATTLASDKTSLDERRRLEEALAAAAGAAGNDALGKALKEAAAQAAKGDRAGAAEQLAKAGAGMQRQAQRDAAARQANELAKALRQAGGDPQGAGALAKLDQNAAPAGARALAPPKGLPPGLLGPPPKRGNGGQQGGGAQRNQPPPIPGQAPPPPGGGQGGQGGGGQGGAGQGQQQIPVPGTPQQGDGGGGGGGAGGQGPIPVPGAALAGGGRARGPGGLKAGHGSQDWRGGASKPPTAGGAQSTVDAAMGQGPQGEVRTAQPGDRREDAATPVDAGPAALLAAAEQALEAEPIPLSRRLQVRQYFALLRERLEGPGTGRAP